MKYLSIFFLLLVSCANSTENATNTDVEEMDNRILKTTHFQILYTHLDDLNIEEIADSLERNYQRIITDLESPALPTVNVHLYNDVSELQEGVKTVEPNLPHFAIGLATSATEIHILSPNHPDYSFQSMIDNTIHEFAHCVSIYINESIPNNPRWLWESVAIYEANQFRNPQNFSYLTSQNPPSLHELSLFSNALIYEVGYVIAEYIIETKGQQGLNELIRNNGDLLKTMNMNEEQFTQEWFQFVKLKYGV